MRHGPVEESELSGDCGADYDFSASPILARRNWRQLIVIPRSRHAYAMDPDKGGDLVWTYQAGKGSGIRRVWGATVDGQQAYFAVAVSGHRRAGRARVNLETGQRVWYTAAKAPICTRARDALRRRVRRLDVDSGCGVLRLRGWGLRDYTTKDGSVIWEFNTNRELNRERLKAKGGSMIWRTGNRWRHAVREFRQRRDCRYAGTFCSRSVRNSRATWEYLWRRRKFPPESGGVARSAGVVPKRERLAMGTTPRGIAMRSRCRSFLMAAPCRACARSRSRLRRAVLSRLFFIRSKTNGAPERRAVCSHSRFLVTAQACSVFFASHASNSAVPNSATANIQTFSPP